MSEITPLILQRFTTELLQSGNIKTKKGLSANSVNSIITVIQNSLKAAYAIGQIKEYSANKIKRPKAREKQVTCFTPTEQKQIEQAVIYRPLSCQWSWVESLSGNKNITMIKINFFKKDVR